MALSPVKTFIRALRRPLFPPRSNPRWSGPERTLQICVRWKQQTVNRLGHLLLQDRWWNDTICFPRNHSAFWARQWWCWWYWVVWCVCGWWAWSEPNPIAVDWFQSSVCVCVCVIFWLSTSNYCWSRNWLHQWTKERKGQRERLKWNITEISIFVLSRCNLKINNCFPCTAVRWKCVNRDLNSLEF